MMTRGRMPLLAMLCLLLITTGAAVVFNSQSGTAAATIGGTEIAYDDGVPYKTVEEATGGVCGDCLTFQGVRFGLGGVTVATVTSVRFYVQVVRAATMLVYLNDALQNPLLSDPVSVYVPRNGWYIVPLPEIAVSGDFFIWIRTPNPKVAVPFHDIKKDYAASFYTENPIAEVLQPVKYGDLMIRATVRAEIHVGKEDRYQYHLIQEAVNAASPFLTIIVHPGTYTENVLVGKRISITSSDGPSVTVVEAADASADVIGIASDGVAVNGFTIRGGSADQVAGVRLQAVTDCLVSNNTILENYYGIRLEEPSADGVCRENTIVQNVVSANSYGIWIGGQRNNISGNRLEDNTAPQGAAIFAADAAIDNWLRFNSFQPAPDRTVQVYNRGMLKPLDAVQNWWGDPTGPNAESGNPDGDGAGAADGVDFLPWLKSEPVYLATGTADVSGYVLDARAGASALVTLAGKGRPVIWVARYSGNPGGPFPTTASDKWVDVCLSDAAGLDTVEITAYYNLDELGSPKDGDVRLYWWDGSQWMVCSNQRLYKEEACIRATITVDSRPGLSNLYGTPFVIGTAPSGTGFQWWWILLAVVLLVGLIAAVRVVLPLLSQRGDYDYDYE